MTLVSVIVPARNAEATLGRTLEALAAQSGNVDFEVVVVDDGSRDATAELARAAGLGPVIATSAVGQGAARNAGVAAARGALLAFTDADCFPTPSWLTNGVAAFADADLVQGAVAPDPLATPGPFDRTLYVDGEHGFYETANLLVRREVFERTPGFESGLGPRGAKLLGEDTLFAWSARRAGARAVFAADALVHHAVIPRGVGGFVAERWRLRYFPELARRIPELRRVPVFLNPRSAAFDLAIAGVASPLPAVTALPYSAIVAREALAWGPRLAPRVAAASVAADAVGAAALVLGSIRARTLLI